MNKITVSAPGKLMLLGEHAVLYNHPCLVTAVDKRLYASVEIIDKPEFRLEAAQVGIAGYKKPISKLGKGDIPKGAKFVEAAVKNTLSHPLSLWERARVRVDSGKIGMTVGMRVVTKSKFSPNLGFGSSSAITACVVKAISQLFNLKLSKKEIFDIAYKTTLDIQGKGSGFDVAAAVYGSTLYFITGGKVIEHINKRELPLIVGYSGVKADTVSLINKVKESFANRQNRLGEIYNDIAKLVNQGEEALIKTDWRRFGAVMNQNQDYLRELGVSSDKLEKMISGALNAGAYGAKLSGAGGGDCMIALVSNGKREKVKEAIKKVGGEVIGVKINAEGVRRE